MDNILGASQMPTIVFLVIFIWSTFWKGLALWKAAILGQKNWFIGLLIINLLGIPELIYLFFFAKKKMQLTELKFWETK